MVERCKNLFIGILTALNQMVLKLWRFLTLG